MPMQLLQRLAEAEMPVTLSDPAEIHQLRILVAVGHVFATVPLPYYGLDGRWCQEAATVHCVTALGFKVLRYFAPADKASTIAKDRGS